MIQIKIKAQPDDITCGPTCLHAVYNYFDYEIPLGDLISEVRNLENGGTLAVFLGIDALKRGFHTRIITYNLLVFDPSWKHLGKKALIEKLKEQYELKKNGKLRTAIKAYIKYLNLGGELSFELLTPSLLKKYFKRKLPLLTGVSATYLYDDKREYSIGDKTVYDDVKGVPTGHFIVLHGFNEDHKVLVADPYTDNLHKNRYYSIEIQRLINSILLGVVTYDANILVINTSPIE
ncbi:MAG TPA: hypothetical protein DCX54_01965 [Flavobacteriales bacterium]|nr:hypothetical protein [Flavobacteriales bacterium]